MISYRFSHSLKYETSSSLDKSESSQVALGGICGVFDIQELLLKLDSEALPTRKALIALSTVSSPILDLIEARDLAMVQTMARYIDYLRNRDSDKRQSTKPQDVGSFQRDKARLDAARIALGLSCAYVGAIATRVVEKVNSRVWPTTAPAELQRPNAHVADSEPGPSVTSHDYAKVYGRQPQAKPAISSGEEVSTLPVPHSTPKNPTMPADSG